MSDKFRRSGASVLRNKGSLNPAPRGEAALQLGKALANAVGLKAKSNKKGSGKKKKKNGQGGANPSVSGIPMAYGSALRNSFPKTASTGRCRELVADLATNSQAGTFLTLVDLPLNPGNSRLFVRTTAMADLYEMYRFKYLRFVYEPSTAVTSSGVVGMYIDYDPVDAAVASMPSLMANESSIMGPLYVPLTLNLDSQARSKQWYYTQQQTSDTASANDRLQDPGDFRFCCDKCPANLSLGYLFVEYEIEFVHPKPPQSLVFLSGFSAASQTAPISFSVPAYVSLSTVTNRGFGLVVHDSVTDDETPQVGTNVVDVYDFVTCSGVSAPYSVAATFYVDVSVTGSYALGLWGVPPNSAAPVIYATTSASLTTAGNQQMTLYSANVSIPNGTRLFFQVTNNTSSTTSIAIRSTSVGSVTAYSQANVGGAPTFQQAEVIESSMNFYLPDQVTELIAFANTLSGPVFLTECNRVTASFARECYQRANDALVRRLAGTFLLDDEKSELSSGQFRLVRTQGGDKTDEDHQQTGVREPESSEQAVRRAQVPRLPPLQTLQSPRGSDASYTTVRYTATPLPTRR